MNNRQKTQRNSAKPPPGKVVILDKGTNRFNEDYSARTNCTNVSREVILERRNLILNKQIPKHFANVFAIEMFPARTLTELHAVPLPLPFLLKSPQVSQNCNFL